MTQVFTENGLSVPVTVIEVEPNYVTQVKTPERDGYSAVQLGYGEEAEQAEAGHVKNLKLMRHLEEVSLRREMSAPAVGQADRGGHL